MRVNGRPTKRLARVALAVAAVVSLGAAAPSADRLRQIDQAREQVLDDSYQKELPGAEAAAKVATERAARERDAMVDTREYREPAPSRFANILLWGLVIVFGALLALWLVSELARFGGDAELPLEDDDAHARLAAQAQAIIERPLGDADELARRGEFAEAIHTLLLRTLH